MVFILTSPKDRNCNSLFANQYEQGLLAEDALAKQYLEDALAKQYLEQKSLGGLITADHKVSNE